MASVKHSKSVFSSDQKWKDSEMSGGLDQHEALSLKPSESLTWKFVTAKQLDEAAKPIGTVPGSQ